MLRTLLALPILALIFFYAWALAVQFGVVIGIHLAMLVVSLLYLCTPVASYLYIIGLLPGNTHRDSRGGIAVLIWFALLLFNFITFSYVPSIYNGTIVTAALQNILITPSARYVLFSLSGIALLYHWAVSHIKRMPFRILAHCLGIAVSALIFFSLYSMYRDTLVITLHSDALNY